MTDQSGTATAPSRARELTLPNYYISGGQVGLCPDGYVCLCAYLDMPIVPPGPHIGVLDPETGCITECEPAASLGSGESAQIRRRPECILVMGRKAARELGELLLQFSATAGADGTSSDGAG